MELTKDQTELLITIQGKLRRGDINSIAMKLGLTREYVGKVLNPNHPAFNEDIVKVTVEFLSKRKQVTKTLIEKLISAA